MPTTSPALDLPEDTDIDTDTHTVVRPRLQLSATQVVASALAAITATVAASYLGVAGTVIGAALASVLTVVGNAVYSHSLRRTGDRVITTVRTAVPAAARFAPRHPESAPIVTVSAPARPAKRARRTWPVVAAACVGVFAGVLLVVTAAELVAGRPISDVLRDKPGSGTSVLGGTTQHSASTTPAPQVTVTVTPTVVTSTPTMTVTGTPVTTTVTPTSTSTSTPTPTPTSTPTPTPTPSPPAGSASATPSAG